MDEAPQTVSAITPRDLTRLITDLQVGIRKFAMYSGTHAIIPELVASLTGQLETVLRAATTLQIGVTKDEILYQGTAIAADNPVVRELARMLNQLNIAGVTFRQGLSQTEVHRFLHLLAECRGLVSLTDRDLMIERFCREVHGVALHFISFQGAVRQRDHSSPVVPESDEGAEAPHLWRGLVNRLMTDDLPDAARAALHAAEGEQVDVEQLAAAINLLGLQRKAGAQSYERTIVSYLQERASHHAGSGEQRARVNQELGNLFAKLAPDVRQRILQASLDPAGGDAAPAEALLDALPRPMLLDVLSRINVSSGTVSLPTLSLLKKFVTVAESDEALMEPMQAKLHDQRDLMEELLTKRADRTFYPAQYRALLDEEFAQRPVSAGQASAHPEAALDETAVDHHLALILLEMLEAPLRSEEQYTQTVASLKDLIARGLGDRTSAVFTDALAVLGRRYASAPAAQRGFFRDRVQELFQPELVGHLLGPLDADDARQREALTQLLGIVGASVIQLLLDRLEQEQNLKARKRLLGLLRDCGDSVIPPAVGRLQHPQWYVVRNMLLLLRDLHAVKAVPDMARCLHHASAQVRLAAFQALGSLAPQTDEFLHALQGALRDDDPKVFRAAVTHIVSARDAGSLELAGRFLIEDAGGRQGERQIAVLKAIEQAGTAAMLPLLHAIRRRHGLRFWTWRKTQAVRNAASRAEAMIRAREASSGVGRQDAA